MRLCWNLLFSLAFIVPVLAQTPRPASEPRPGRFSFAPVVKLVRPAVVNVYGARVVQNPMAQFMEDPVFRQLFGEGSTIPRERVQSSLGSGVILSSEGLVVTNYHVIEQVDQVKVALSDRREYEADIILRDPRSDLAVLRLRAGQERFPALPLGDADALEVGDLVLAVGNPFGVGQTVTSGIVSALARTHVGISDYQFFIQTDAAINPGNSGGALVDVDGRLVGINSAIYSRGGGSNGIGFAIPVNMVKIVLESARAGSSTVRRPWFGAKLQVVSAEIAESLNLPRPQGAIVSGLSANSPASRAGLRIGDVILTVDGQDVNDPDSFGFRFGTKAVGGVASLGVYRQGQSLVIPLQLEVAAETRPRDIWKVNERGPFLGASFGNLSPALAEELRIDADWDGVAVTAVEAGSPAAQIGLRPGDILRGLNNEPIKTTAQLRGLLADRKRSWRVEVERGGRVLTSVIGG